MQARARFSITVEEAAALLVAGRVCAFPTETVYGLGADAANANAVLAIYETKGRPRFNPLICHCADLAMAAGLAEIPPLAEALTVLWPGPLTLVLPKRPGAPIADLVTAGLDTVGIRVPDHPIAQAVIRAVGRPIAAPSANPSGRLSPTTAAQVHEAFEGRVPVVDGGPCKAGVESTIVAVSHDAIVQLRPGAVPREQIEAIAGRPVTGAGQGAGIAAPGMMASHYAPRARLRLSAAAPADGEAYLAFGHEPPLIMGPVRNLSPESDLREAARNLFAMLHELDATGCEGIAVAPIPPHGLGEAINDRLARAAAPRV